jgi:uncharacterized protein (TIGR03083 family)
MEVPELIDQLRVDGLLMAEAAATAGLDAVVPSCPAWRVRDLVQHTGGVHRFATRHVANGLREFLDLDLVDYTGGTWPPDHELIRWFSDGVAHLADTLRGADPNLEVVTFLKAPSPLAFWARRQADETAIHRIDAQLAASQLAASQLAAARVTEFPAEFAAQGVDELLSCFIVRPFGELRSEAPRTIAVHSTDTGDRWLLRITSNPVVTERNHGDRAECTIAGSASDLFRALWNRPPAAELTVAGDRALFDLFQERIHIRWS